MLHPLDRPSKPTGRAWLFFWFLLATFSYAQYPMGKLGQPLVNHTVAYSGIISFELAGSVDAINAILESWDEKAKSCAAKSLMYDVGFIILYVLTMSYSCLLAARCFDGLGPQWAKLTGFAVALAWAQLAAGVLDLAENGCLGWILYLHRQERDIVEPWPQLAAICAALKFAILGAGICCVLTAVLFTSSQRVPGRDGDG